MKQMERHENKFIELFNLRKNTQQKIGSAWDAETFEGERIEFKADISAEKTGNTFVEFNYSNDSGENWRDSGINLAKDQAKWWVIQVGDKPDYRWMLTADLVSLIENGNFRQASIRKSINGNSQSIRCMGHLIPLSIIEGILKPAPVSKKKKVDKKDNPFL